MLKAWLSSFLTAWNLLVEIPITSESDSDSEDYADNNRIIASFPIVGFAIGFIFWIFTSFMSIFFGSSVKVIISSLLIAVGMELIGGGKNLISLGNLLEALIYRGKGRDPLIAVEETAISGNKIGIFVTLALFILRLFCLGVLINNGFSNWIFVVMTGSFAAQSIFCTASSLDSGGKFIDGDEKGVILAWILAVILSIISGNSVKAVVISFLIVYILFSLVKNYLQSKAGGMTAQMIGSAGTAAELLILILGLTILARN